MRLFPLLIVFTIAWNSFSPVTLVESHPLNKHIHGNKGLSRPVVLLDDEVDPQDEWDERVQWLTANELRERLLKVDQEGRSQDVADPLPNAKRRLDVMVAPAGDINSLDGPVYPVFEDDLPPDEEKTFAGEHLLIKPEKLRIIEPSMQPGCDLLEVADCGPQLSRCLAQDISDYDNNICPCYFQHGQCYARAGCNEMLPRSDIQYCFNVLHCSKDDCLGKSPPPPKKPNYWWFLLLLLLVPFILYGFYRHRKRY